MSEAEGTEGLYRAALLARARAPLFAAPPVRVDALGVADNAFCGDRVEVMIERGAEGRLAAVGFFAEGCAILTASADLMAEHVRGLDAAAVDAAAARFAAMVEGGAEAPALGTLQALREVSAYPSRRRCALLPWEALQKALSGARRAA